MSATELQAAIDAAAHASSESATASEHYFNLVRIQRDYAYASFAPSALMVAE
jgi:hypothetical protein